MSLREQLLNNAGRVKVLFACIILIFATIIAMELLGLRHPRPKGLNQAFYSDDDGKTWFLDDAVKISPFDHGGRQACRAVIFRCADGNLFVGYLARYSDAQRTQIRNQLSKDPSSVSFLLASMAMSEMKKPGEAKWGTGASGAISGAPAVACPQDSSPARLVVPSDADTGATN